MRQVQAIVHQNYINVTLSAKTSLMLGVHKAGFRREGHKYVPFSIILVALTTLPLSATWPIIRLASPDFQCVAGDYLEQDRLQTLL